MTRCVRSASVEEKSQVLGGDHELFLLVSETELEAEMQQAQVQVRARLRPHGELAADAG